MGKTHINKNQKLIMSVYYYNENDASYDDEVRYYSNSLPNEKEFEKQNNNSNVYYIEPRKSNQNELKCCGILSGHKDLQLFIVSGILFLVNLVFELIICGCKANGKPCLETDEICIRLENYANCNCTKCCPGIILDISWIIDLVLGLAG